MSGVFVVFEGIDGVGKSTVCAAVAERLRARGLRVVLCDRYFASTVAYQSAKLDGDATDRDWLISINSDFTGRPDATILLDMDPQDSLGWVDSRGEEVSKFENLGFLEQVRRNYLDLARTFGFHVVDASKGREDVLADVMAIIDRLV